jgi:hypothetical protein
MQTSLSVPKAHRKLLLVGGCDLLQLTNYCNSHDVEFVNFMNIRNSRMNVLSCAGAGIRYDDPAFFTADRALLRDNQPVRRLSGWTFEDAVLLNENIAQADIIILAMRGVLRHHYVVTNEKIYIRLRAERLQFYLNNEPEWFKRHFIVADLTTRDRLELIETAFEVLKLSSRDDAIIFILGDNSRATFDLPELSASVSYNNFCRSFCENNPGKFNFVDVRTVVQESSLIDAHPKTALNSNVRIFSSSVRLALLLRALKRYAETDSLKNSTNNCRSSPL